MFALKLGLVAASIVCALFWAFQRPRPLRYIRLPPTVELMVYNETFKRTRLIGRCVFVGPKRVLILGPRLQSREKDTLTIWVAAPWGSTWFQARLEQPAAGLLAFARIGTEGVYCPNPLRFRSASPSTKTNWSAHNRSLEMWCTPWDQCQEVSLILPSSTKDHLFEMRYDDNTLCPGDVVYDALQTPVGLFLGRFDRTKAPFVLDGSFVQKHVAN